MDVRVKVPKGGESFWAARLDTRMGAWLESGCFPDVLPGTLRVERGRRTNPMVAEKWGMNIAVPRGVRH